MFLDVRMNRGLQEYFISPTLEHGLFSFVQYNLLAGQSGILK